MDYPLVLESCLGSLLDIPQTSLIHLFSLLLLHIHNIIYYMNQSSIITPSSPISEHQTAIRLLFLVLERIQRNCLPLKGITLFGGGLVDVALPLSLLVALGEFTLSLRFLFLLLVPGLFCQILHILHSQVFGLVLILQSYVIVLIIK